jgi:AcrR family transcriptional regulator
MSTTDRPRRDVERNHQAILSAAIAVLADAPQATMADIARASGTGRSTLYRHFPDREALIAAIFARILAQAGAIVTRWLPGAGGEDPIETLIGLSSELAAIGDDYRFLEHQQAQLNHRDPHRPRPNEAILLSYLSTHQRRGHIRTDLPADWLLLMLEAVIKGAAERRGDSDRSALIRATLTSLLAGS